MNLLTDRVFSIDTASGGSRTSLPELLARLANDEVKDFPCLRAHQRPAWHVLLVQLATLALEQGNEDQLRSSDEWRQGLRALTPGYVDDAPWRLVVDDWMQPAFLQPPCVVEANRSDHKRAYSSADALDVLVTSKNHDLKAERMWGASAEEWVFALATLQTTEGFLGAGNYGIARMNGGFASRPVVRCAAADLGFGGQVFRDVVVLRRRATQLRTAAAELGVGETEPNHRLLWVLPWDGTNSLSPAHLHPLAIEICRRIRLVGAQGALRAVGATSKVARVSAGELKGVLGDPWIPVNRDENKAFTVSADGFGYAKVVALLRRKQFSRPLLAEIEDSDRRDPRRNVTLHFAALARGQGKTEGFHEREVRLSPRAVRLFADDEPGFAHRAEQFVELAGAVGGKALRPAVIQLLQGKESPDWKKPSNAPLAAPWMKRFDEHVDAMFFSELSESIELEESETDAEARWARRLAAVARHVLVAAAEAVPRSEQRHLLARARAESLLDGALYKHLPSLRSVAIEGDAA